MSKWQPKNFGRLIWQLNIRWLEIFNCQTQFDPKKFVINWKKLSTFDLMNETNTSEQMSIKWATQNGHVRSFLTFFPYESSMKKKTYNQLRMWIHSSTHISATMTKKNNLSISIEMIPITQMGSSSINPI
jgi:hypothetical protein